MQLQYLQHNQIDFEKWDNALAKCHNKLIYAESVYLNTIATTWDAIVNEDWTCIMPFPVKKKYGMKYVPQLPFIQQLGLFNTKIITEKVFEEFVLLLQKKIWKIDYNVNYACNFSLKNQCNNFTLSLNDNYNTIKVGFKNDLKKDLLKHSELEIEKTTNIEVAVKLFFETYKNRLALLTTENHEKFLNLSLQLAKQNSAFVYEACFMDELLAIALFFKDEHRIYNIASTILDKGKKLSANHFLYNQVIADFSNQPIILDFEGSDIPGIANFYKQFGSTNQSYSKLEKKLLGRF